jgi:predicted RNA-binding Zn-ribbon protein involved in translation (DUF1610 family)
VTEQETRAVGAVRGAGPVDASADVSGAGEATPTRAVPFYCPFCGEEELEPADDKGGSWGCAACLRAFRLSFTGIYRKTAPTREASS